ncbi:MAG: hypothetical protein ISS83_00305 [Candidatus Pacebacteria bacterium]|nr:hypothetical protein [Candidatus Paceibacterota bacterium]
MTKKWHVKGYIVDELKLLIDNLANLGILELGEFKLKHHEGDPTAPKSPFKINLRTREYGGPLIPDAVEAIAEVMFHLIKGERFQFDLVAGVPQAGEPFAEAISRLSGKPLLKLKKEVIDGKRRITGIAEGKFSLGQVVLLIDDVLSFGETKEEAILAIRKAGLIVSDLVIFLDREQGGKKEMERLDCRIHSAISLWFVIHRCLAKGRISREKHDQIIAYIESTRKTH